MIFNTLARNSKSIQNPGQKPMEKHCLGGLDTDGDNIKMNLWEKGVNM